MSIFCTIQLNDDTCIDFTSEYPIKNKFDNVMVFYRGKNKEENIFEDVIQEAVTTLYNGMKKCLANQILLNPDLEVGRLGEAWNIWTNNLPDEVGENEVDIFQHYWVWSSREFQTWIYQKDGKSYIEISPSYRWHFVEPTKDEPFFTFNEFIEEYRSVVIELSLEQITKTIELLEKIKKELNIS